MTREERDKTIRILQWLHDNNFLFRSTEEDVKFATEYAIKALEQEKESVLDKIFPDNATNGDMIKTIFPNLEWRDERGDTKSYILEPEHILSPKLIAFNSWWDAPYKALEQEPFINKPCVSSGVCEHDKNKVLDKIRAEIIEEKDFAYADFEQYKVEYLGVDAEYVDDELPQDDFRYGMERAVEIIDKYKVEG